MTNIIETDSMTKAGIMRKVEVIIGIIRTSEVGTTLEMVGIEVDIMEVSKEILRIERGHITEVEAGIKMTGEDLGGIDEIVDIEVGVGQTLGIKVKEKVSILQRTGMVYDGI